MKKEVVRGVDFFFKSWDLSLISGENMQNKWNIKVIIMKNFFNRKQQLNILYY